jgi:hypothetical protein
VQKASESDAQDAVLLNLKPAYAEEQTMGYRVKIHPTKNGPGWKVQFEDRTEGKRRTKDIRKDTWGPLGFRSDMTYAEACQIRDSLNAQEALKTRQRARNRIEARIAEEAEVECALLPQIHTDEFRRRYLLSGQEQNPKTESYWRAAKKMIRKLQIDPEEWFELKHLFYAYFAKNKISPSYMTKVLRIANLWGHFYCRKHKKAFLQIPSPRGAEAQRIADSFFDASEGGEDSGPLTPELLEVAQSKLTNPAHYNWLYLSVWFGLRPEEVDHVKNETRTRIVQNGKTTELHVYQSKLASVARSKRWKIIPCKEKEQLAGLEIIRTAPIKRPLNKTLRLWVDKDVTCYGGRKNFTDLMLDRGHKFEDISMWMGHATIERTWRNYKDRQRSRPAA